MRMRRRQSSRRGARRRHAVDGLFQGSLGAAPTRATARVRAHPEIWCGAMPTDVDGGAAPSLRGRGDRNQVYSHYTGDGCSHQLYRGTRSRENQSLGSRRSGVQCNNNNNDNKCNKTGLRSDIIGHIQLTVNKCSVWICTLPIYLSTRSRCLSVPPVERSVRMLYTRP